MSARWQKALAEDDIGKAALVAKHGKYMFRRLLFGIFCAPWICQRAISVVLARTGPGCSIFCQMDDLLSLTYTFEKHHKPVEFTFVALQTAGWLANP